MKVLEIELRRRRLRYSGPRNSEIAHRCAGCGKLRWLPPAKIAQSGLCKSCTVRERMRRTKKPEDR